YLSISRIPRFVPCQSPRRNHRTGRTPGQLRAGRRVCSLPNAVQPDTPMTLLRPDLPALARIDTPALIIDEAALRANIERMAKSAAARNVALRPHAKTHKSALIARRQMKAGAIGIACATLREAEALTEAGVTGLLVTSPVVGADKAARLARLNRVS